LIPEMGMTLLERLQVLLAHAPPIQGLQSRCPARYIASPVDAASITSHSTRSTSGWPLRKYCGFRVKTVFTFGS
jgi:hypothetical protein